MTKEEFLNSGLLEEYVMGLLSDDESAKVGAYIASNPSIKKLLLENEEAILNLANSQGVTPPKGAKASILDAINEIENPVTGSSGTFIKSILPILAGLLLAVSIYSLIQWKNSKNELKDLKEKFATLSKDCEEAQKLADQNNALIAFNQNPDTKSSILVGNANAPDFDLLARHNKVTGELSLEMINPIPLPPSKVLCLWGDKNGEMILISRLDDESQNNLIAYDPEMVSLNVTIEKNMDDIDHPDLTQVVASVAI